MHPESCKVCKYLLICICISSGRHGINILLILWETQCNRGCIIHRHMTKHGQVLKTAGLVIALLLDIIYI